MQIVPGSGPTPTIRDFHHAEFPVDVLADLKGDTSVSVCLPARNEASTVGQIVTTLVRGLQAEGVVDEVLVIDDHSTDRTASVAAAAGARVVDAGDILIEHGPGHGKGEVLWKSLHEATGDVIVWCDADLRRFDTRFVRGVLGPLLSDPEVVFAKGHYRRPESPSGDGGGRVTELVARPLLSMFFPELCGFVQPLSGEYGGRRDALEQVPFVCGYGVEVGLLIDVAARFGTARMVQVDLDERHHRNRPLTELSPQAAAVAQTILRRAHPDLIDEMTALVLADGSSVPISVDERPPMVGVESYLARTA